MLSLLDDTDESIADTDCDDQVNNDNNADDTELSTEPTKLKETVIEALSSDGWNFSHLEEAGTVFPGGLSLTTPSAYTPIITHSGVGTAPLRKLNYPALSYLMNGQYYTEYRGTLSLMGLPVMSEKSWDKAVAWL